MNKILHLFNQAYVTELFSKELLPLYPDFKGIKKVKIIPIKKHVWETTYHVVIKFAVSFQTESGGLAVLPIYITAHSSESRKNSFEALSYLWQSGFGQGNLAIPRPLFFSDKFNGGFYRGVRGKTLFDYISNHDYKVMEDIIVKTAAWFAKLHSLSTREVKNFNPENSRIETVVPGLGKILRKINLTYPKYYQPCKKIYEVINGKEQKYFSAYKRRDLIHGDAHPQNVVRVSKNKVAIIDYTDMCLADFARDLGSFTQQLEFMARKKIKDQAYIEKMKGLFLRHYLLNSKIKIDDHIKERIEYYYNWTALRTATYFLLKENPEPLRADELISKIRQSLKI